MNSCVRRVSIQDPASFWEAHVAARDAAVLEAITDSPDLRGLTKWTDQYLQDTVGSNVQVKVEVRANATDSFGRGSTRSMSFHQFLKAFIANEETMYLSAQEVAVGRDGYPELCAAPVLQLLQDLPLQPQIMGSLVPRQINVWMGRTTHGSSSGLHHDYHDNLYVLLRGRKRFRLFPPQDAYKLYTHGTVRRIHANGRIVYAGQGEVNADGSAALDVARWAARIAEDAVSSAHAAVKQGDVNGAALLAAAEERLEVALDASLDMSLNDAFEDISGSDTDDGDGDGDSDIGGSHDDMHSKCNTGESHDPDSFSQIDLADSTDADIKKRFPMFPGRSNAIEVELHAGEALYLPAGTFHEVTSYNSVGEGDSNGHLAVNWWFMPPDNLDAGNPDQPYTSGFWPAFWKARQSQLQAFTGQPPLQLPPDQQEADTSTSAHERSNLESIGHCSTMSAISNQHSSKKRISGKHTKHQRHVYLLHFQNSRCKHHRNLNQKFQRR